MSRQAAVDALTSERFGDPIWFRSVPAEVLDPQMQALRQLELYEAADDEDEEATNGLVQDGRFIPESSEGPGDPAP
jgi:hypothetical protein